MEYRYVVLRQQPSLYSPETENFAVLVEGRVPTGQLIFAVGRSPEPKTPVSEVGKAISARMPELLTELVNSALSTQRPGEDVLESLGHELKWNFQVTKPERLEDDDPIHQVAFKLFAEKIAGADRLVNMLEIATTRNLRVPEPKERVGETFQTAVSIPQKSMAAD